jgi:hypothetical protein
LIGAIQIDNFQPGMGGSRQLQGVSAKGKIMKHAIVALIALVLCAPAVVPAAGDDPAAPVRQFIDGFNSGDVQSAFAAYATGPITIVDEFAPHIWSGPNAAHEWADAYDNHAKATGVTDGKVTYGKPTRVEEVADAAYVVIPTVYLYKEHGKAIKEEGQVTAVLHRESGAWKIRAWIWSGVKPHPAR